MKGNVIYSSLIVLLNTLYPIIVFPYISRVFSIELIGTYNFYSLVFAYFVIIANFGINLYGSKEVGKLKDNLQEKSRFVSQMFFINLLNCSLVFLITVIPLSLIARVDEVPVILLFSTLIFSTAFSFEWFYVGEENQKYIFFRNLCIKLFSLIFIYVFIKRDSDFVFYILIVVSTNFINAIINFYNLRKRISISFQGLKFLSHYKVLFGIFAVETCFRYFGMGDIAIVEKFISREQLGFLTFSLSIYNISASFLKIIATTLLPRASYYIESKQEDKFKKLLQSSFNFIYLFGFGLILGINFLSAEIVTVLGGAKFINSRYLLQSFLPLLIITSIINVFVFQYYYPLKKTNLIIKVYIVSILSNIILNVLLAKGIPTYSYVLSSTITHLLILLYFLIIEKCWKFFSKDSYKYFVGFAVCFVLLHIGVEFISSTTLLVVTIGCGISLYFLIVFFLKDPLLYKFLKSRLNVKI